MKNTREMLHNEYDVIEMGEKNNFELPESLKLSLNIFFHQNDKSLNRHFSREDIQWACKYMNICSTPPIIREIQIKNSMRHHLIPVRMVTINNQQATSIGEDVAKRVYCW